MLDARDTMVDGNFSQVEFALSSWRETFLKLKSPARFWSEFMAVRKVVQ
jgi:hypothetical protein